MITEVIQQMAADLSASIIPAYQVTANPAYPFGTWIVRELSIDKPQTKIRAKAGVPDNMVDVTSRYVQHTVVTLNFYNSQGTGDIASPAMDLARRAWLWFYEKGRDVCRQYNTVPEIHSRAIGSEIRTVNSSNKYRAGFDICLTETVNATSSVEAMLGVDYTITTY